MKHAKKIEKLDLSQKAPERGGAKGAGIFNSVNPRNCDELVLGRVDVMEYSKSIERKPDGYP